MLRKAFCALLLLMTAVPLLAGVEYEFRQTLSSQVEGIPSRETAGKAVIDGNRSRVDYTAGSSYGSSAYVITDNATRKVTVVNPVKATFASLDVREMTAALAATPIRIENLKSDLKRLDDRPSIAGYPTDHYRLTASYDITVSFGQLSVKQRVQTTVDKWTTPTFGAEAEAFLGAVSLQTGNPEVDKLVDAETQKISGFPLRQTVVVTTSSPGAKGGKLQSQGRSQTTELTVTKIRPRAIEPAMFTVPPGFKQVQYREMLQDREAVEDLTLEKVPATK